MGPKIGHNDVLERNYEAKFQSAAARFGIGINYKFDRATIDWGLHLTEPQSEFETVTQTRVWFQFKGIRKNTLSRKAFNLTEVVSCPIQLDHLRQWYFAQEATYLVYYVESADTFIAEDVRTIVDREWGDALFKKNTQKEVTIKLPKTARVDSDFWRRLRQHRSMRIDGNSYVGIPLPHNRNVRSEIVERMEPELFTQIIETLLAEHGYRQDAPIDTTFLYPRAQASGDLVSGSRGVLYHPYEWSLQLTQELLPDETGFCSEGKTLRSHGKCAVIIHSHVASRPDVPSLKTFVEELATQGIFSLLVFVNQYMFKHDNNGAAYNCFPEFSQACAGTEGDCVPQHLEDLSRTLLTKPKVYLPFQDRIAFWSDDIRQRIKVGELHIES